MTTPLTAAGASDAGLQRGENQDRVHLDLARGLFIVIDGDGRPCRRQHRRRRGAGHAAQPGSSERPGRWTSASARRSRWRTTRSIALAASRPEWLGMACVLTVAVVKDRRRDDRTRRRRAAVQAAARRRSRRSPGIIRRWANGRTRARSASWRRCGTRAATRSIATWGPSLMRPATRTSSRSDTLPFEPDAALVAVQRRLERPGAVRRGIARLVERHAGDPQAAVRALVAAANQAGGKDNVTALCVLGADVRGRVAPARRGWAAGRRGPSARPSPY